MSGRTINDTVNEHGAGTARDVRSRRTPSNDSKTVVGPKTFRGPEGPWRECVLANRRVWSNSNSDGGGGCNRSRSRTHETTTYTMACEVNSDDKRGVDPTWNLRVAGSPSGTDGFIFCRHLTTRTKVSADGALLTTTTGTAAAEIGAADAAVARSWPSGGRSAPRSTQHCQTTSGHGIRVLYERLYRTCVYVCLRLLLVDGRARAARVRVRVCESRVYRFAGDKVIDCVVRHSRRARNDEKRDSRGGRRRPRPWGGERYRRTRQTDVLRVARTQYSYMTCGDGGGASCVSSARQTWTARQTESAFQWRRDRGLCGNRSRGGERTTPAGIVGRARSWYYYLLRGRSRGPQ